jgi:diguanylate cyclase (GGDEF)-like protein
MLQMEGSIPDTRKMDALPIAGNIKWPNALLAARSRSEGIDTFGHQTGDQLLSRLSKRLQSTLREVDNITRLSSDEFVISINQIESQSNVDTIAQKILQSLDKAFDIENNQIFVSASIGIANYPNDASLVSLSI